MIFQRALLLLGVFVGVASGRHCLPPVALQTPLRTAESTPTADAVAVVDAAADVVDPAREALRAALPRNENLRCPVSFTDANVVLARVGTVEITACSLALERAMLLREGLPPLNSRELLQRLVSHALLEQEARTRGMEQDPSVLRRTRATLAAALVRDEALREAAREPVRREQVERYVHSHETELGLAERVRLREIVVSSEAAARTLIQSLRERSFEELVREHTISTTGRRDQGDLGLVTQGGNDRVPAAVAAAGWALQQPGDVAQEPVRIEHTEFIGRRRRPRVSVQWHVVQLVERIPQRTMETHLAHRVAAHRLSFGPYASARASVSERLEASLTQTNQVRIDERALRRVRMQPRDEAQDPPRRH